MLYPASVEWLGGGGGELVIEPNLLAPVVQRPANFIQWISQYPTVSICAKISVFPLV